LIGLCFAGAWISGQLVREQAGPWPSTTEAKSLFSQWCGGGAATPSGCDTVLASRWSAVDFSFPVFDRSLSIRPQRVVVPVAFVGLAYFVFLGTWFVLGAPPRAWGHGWYLIPLLTAGCGAVGSMVLLWFMIFTIETWCFWCAVTHAINGLIVIGAWWLRPRRDAVLRERGRVAAAAGAAAFARAMFRAPDALRTCVVAAVLVTGLWIYRDTKLETRAQVANLLPFKKFVDERMDDSQFLVREYLSQPRLWDPKETEDFHDPTLLVFSDFECPHCACFASKWRTEYRRRWSGPLRVEFRHLPLDKACNDSLAKGVHLGACEASYAAEAARLQGGNAAFQQMHDGLFQFSRELGVDTYRALAQRFGLDEERLVADMGRRAVREAVARDVALADELGVTGTPSLILNGRPVPDFCANNPVFWQAVSNEFARRAADANRTPVPSNVHADTGAS
jgi:hypothetical protein